MRCQKSCWIVKDQIAYSWNKRIFILCDNQIACSRNKRTLNLLSTQVSSRYKFLLRKTSKFTFGLISSSLISFFSEGFDWAAAVAASALASSFSAFSLAFCSALRRLFSSLQSGDRLSSSSSGALYSGVLLSNDSLRTSWRTVAETSDATSSRGSQARLVLPAAQREHWLTYRAWSSGQYSLNIGLYQRDVLIGA